MPLVPPKTPDTEQRKREGGPGGSSFTEARLAKHAKLGGPVLSPSAQSSSASAVGPPSSAASAAECGTTPGTTAALQLLYSDMNSVVERFGPLDGILMQQKIDECYMEP